MGKKPHRSGPHHTKGLVAYPNRLIDRNTAAIIILVWSTPLTDATRSWNRATLSSWNIRSV